MKVPKGIKNGPIIIIDKEGEPTLTLERRLAEDRAQPDYDTWPEWRKSHANWIHKEITDQKVTTFDTRTKMYADNSVYQGKKGLYIKKGGRKYYLEEFK